MRTTIELPDELLKRAKIEAATKGVSLKTVVVNALEQTLPPAKVKHRRGVPAFSTGGPPIPDLTSEEIADATFGSVDDYLSRGH
jgi:hypothetical protein